MKGKIKVGKGDRLVYEIVPWSPVHFQGVAHKVDSKMSTGQLQEKK